MQANKKPKSKEPTKGNCFWILEIPLGILYFLHLEYKWLIKFIWLNMYCKETICLYRWGCGYDTHVHMKAMAITWVTLLFLLKIRTIYFILSWMSILYVLPRLWKIAFVLGNLTAIAKSMKDDFVTFQIQWALFNKMAWEATIACQPCTTFFHILKKITTQIMLL